MHNNFNCYYDNVLQSNDDSTKRLTYLAECFIKQTMYKGFCSFILCANEMIEYFYSVTKLYYRTKPRQSIVKKVKKQTKQKQKQNLGEHNMLLVTID